MKIIGNIFKWLFISILGLSLLVLLLLALDRDTQSADLSMEDRMSIKVHKEYSSKVDSNLYKSLKEEYGRNKTLAKGFEYQCLLALSHYPQLKETPIDFVVQPAYLQLSARPDPKTILFPWIKRKYLVIISNDTGNENDPILLKRTPFNEQVGIIGHELAHIVFYLDKKAMYFVPLAYKYKYRFKEFAKGFERDTDKRAIAHGLGYQLYDFAFFVRKAFGDTQEEIEEDKGGLYLSPSEIAQEMSNYQYFYKDPLEPASHYFLD